MIDNLSPAGPAPAPSVDQADYPWKVQPLAFRVAAGILGANILITLLDLPLGQAPNVITMVIDAILVIGLLQLRSGARGFALFRAYAGAVILSLMAIFQFDPLNAAISIVVQLGYSGSLVLLLQGQTKNWKVYTAVGIFVVVVFIPLALLLLLALLLGL